MSCIVKGKIEIASMAVMRSAVDMSPKLELVENQDGSHTIKLKDAATERGNWRSYQQLTFTKSKTSPDTYDYAYDSDSGELAKAVGGKNLDTLKMHYAMQAAKFDVESRGDSISFQQEPDGSWRAEVDTYVSLGV